MDDPTQIGPTFVVSVVSALATMTAGIAAWKALRAAQKQLKIQNLLNVESFLHQSVNSEARRAVVEGSPYHLDITAVKRVCSSFDFAALFVKNDLIPSDMFFQFWGDLLVFLRAHLSEIRGNIAFGNITIEKYYEHFFWMQKEADIFKSREALRTRRSHTTRGRLLNYQDQRFRSGVIIPLRDIMYGLVYPAVFGTGLVLCVLRATKEASFRSITHDSALYLALVAGAFCVLSFTSGSERKEDKSEISYRWATFLIDWCEVVLMFSCYFFLGLMAEGAKAPDPLLSPTYAFLLIDIAVVQPMWRFWAGVDVFSFWAFRAFVAPVMALGLISGLFPGRLHPWVDLIASIAMFISVLAYIGKDPEFRFVSCLDSP